ncbi:MAG: CinA family nicotinamide mononucleotide deamidase-related protein [Dehalococcoidales bacterium]|nr:CinA family nicotinamide mononucleotide deamidase-related protein [Dehalococcoidales bacterium]
MKAEIVSTGSELLLGETADTNSSYLASQLSLLGIDLCWISQVGDNQVRLVEVLERAWQRSELILTTGGLGPTGGDLTRGAIAEMLGEKLEIDSSLEKALRERFARWKMDMPLSNLKQAAIIPSAKGIPNTEGTAPGWWLERDGRLLVAMPGPPRELQEMWQREVQTRLRERCSSVILRKTFKTFGLSEAAVSEMAFPLFSSDNPTLGVYSKPDGIQLRLKVKSENQRQAGKMMAEGEASIRAALGEHIWGTDNDTLEMTIGRLLIQKGFSLAVMEDYSGGWLAASITDIPESPAFFKGGLVASSSEAKVALGVNAETISRYGAVSQEVARAMAEAARTLLRADIAISTTAIEETKERPAGVVYIGIADDKGIRVVNRPRGKRRVSTTALFELRKSLISPTG